MVERTRVRSTTSALAISRVGMFFVAVIVAIMFYEVVMRYFFERPTLWVNEMSLWIGGFIYLLAALYVLQQRGHIRITMLYDIVPRWRAAACSTSSRRSASCIFGAMVIHGGFNEAVQKYGRWETFGTAWDPPIPATMKPAILIVAGLMIAQAIANLIADWNETPVPEGSSKTIVIETARTPTPRPFPTGTTDADRAPRHSNPAQSPNALYAVQLHRSRFLRPGRLVPRPDGASVMTGSRRSSSPPRSSA